MPQTEVSPQPPRRRRGRRLLAVLLILALLVAGVYLAGRGLVGFINDMIGPVGSDVTAPDVEPGQPVEFVVEPGSSARAIGEQLVLTGVIESPLEFEIAVRTGGVADQLQAGTYSLVTGMDVGSTLDVLLAGPQVDSFWLTVVEGLRIGEILDSIARQTDFETTELEEALLSGELQSAFQEDPPDELEDWEGLLFPDSYEFEAEATPAQVLARMAGTLEERVDSVDQSRLEELGVTPYQALVVASFVESEARIDEDRGPIASVVYNRLAQGMPLQIDATVLYALGERGVGLTLEDLETESPYNTYLHPGLPPTPIGAPGLASVQAAFDPPSTDYLYYVLTDPSGAHSFTASYDQFLRFKQQAKDEGVIP